MSDSLSHGYDAALNSARKKAYFHLIPLLFICYVVAYVDRVNVGFAKLRMQEDLGFSETVFGYGMGIFFVGYLVLEIPGTLIVERWSARKWICRIMVTWGILAALTAFVKTANQFYLMRFLLGVGEAGFYPGVIVYLTHWFPKTDRTKALAWFFVGTPIAQFIGPLVSRSLIDIGEDGNASMMGMVGWQWVFIFWGLPAIILGFVVLARLTDRPREAKWLTIEEREALELALETERNEHLESTGHMTVWQALSNPRVLILAAAYFFVVTGNYGVEMYMASIFKDWYSIDVKDVAILIIIPPIGSLIGQIFVGWNSDRTGERTFHAALPILIGAAALFLAPASQGNKVLTVFLFTMAMLGLKAYLPAFWALPNQFLSASAAAASIGMINSFGNLGGAVGPSMLGKVKENTGSYAIGLWILATSMTISACIIIMIGQRGVRKITEESAKIRQQAGEDVNPVPESV
jgi:MFS transporter, ACS family, tartrate transporter